MNTLVAVGTGAAFLYSVVATVAPPFFIARGVAPGRLLRGGDHHHRAHPHRQRVRGAGEAADDVGRAARAGRRCSRRPRARRLPRGRSEVDVPVERRAARRRRDRRAPASASRWTARSLSGEQRGRRVDAHRRVDAGREEAGDRVIGGTINRTGALPLPRHDARRRQRARADRQADARRAGLARADPAAGRPRQRRLRAGGARRSPSSRSSSGSWRAHATGIRRAGSVRAFAARSRC